MSMTTALDELRTANTELQQTIAELMMTALEDRPRGSEIAAVDDLVENISELQASAAQAGTELGGITDSRELACGDAARQFGDRGLCAEVLA